MRFSSPSPATAPAAEPEEGTGGEPAPPSPNPVPLSALQTGEVGVVADLFGEHNLRSRMLTLGLTPGTEVTVLQNYGHGPMIVRVRDARVALGRGEAEKVLVRRRAE